ncbi:MAG: hypothetical protein AB1384_14870 [Actinomycetota bacterium]
MEKTFKHSLFKVVEILGEYLSEVVFAGGWAPLIYYHYLIGDKARTPLLTQEFDLMVGRRIGKRDKSLRPSPVSMYSRYSMNSTKSKACNRGIHSAVSTRPSFCEKA